jgi:thiol-disulfide isomerase/thioredoxin
MTAVAIVIIVGGIVALSALTWFIAQLYAQQQRAEERVLGMMSQLAWLNGRELQLPAQKVAMPPGAAETAVTKPLPEPPGAAKPVTARIQPAETVERAPAAPATPIAAPATTGKTAPPARSATTKPSSPVPKASSTLRATSDETYRGEGLAPGSPLPDFELRTIDGERFRRSQVTARRSAILFLSAEDEGSKAVVDALRSIGSKRKSLPKLIYVFDGGVTDEAMTSWLGRVPKPVTVLLQEDSEVATVLRANGTPSAYLFDAQGMTQGRLRTGAVAILEALGFQQGSIPLAARKANEFRPHAQPTQRSYRGLPDGSAVPELQLPLLTGGTWIGASGPGRQRLVLFWSPDCPPCQRMLPDLANAARNWTRFDAAVIASGSAEDNGDLLTAGLSVPIALQSRQEASRAFQVLESPAAVLVSPEGTIVGEPAIGVQAIWSLIASLEADSGNSMGGEPA